MVSIKLSELVDSIDSQADEAGFYLNKNTGKIELVGLEEINIAEDESTLEDYPEWQQEIIKIAQDILNTDDYIQLPTRFDVHEYSIMEDFCFSLDNEKIKEKLFCAIKDKGSFRRFKDKAFELDVIDDWYKFKEEALKRLP